MSSLIFIYDHNISDSVLGADYSVKCKQVDDFEDQNYGIWEGIVHPSSNRLKNLQNWIGAARRRLQEDAWYMVVEPVATEDGDYYEYYCVVPDAHIITWFEEFNADLLFQECAFAREWNHKWLELEAQFWKHIDFFPRHYSMQPSDATELRAHLEWFLAEGLILEQSTAASLFWSTDQTEKVIARLISFENLLNSNLSLKEQGIAFCRRIWNILSAMFGVPALVLEHVEKLHVDGIVNLLDIREFLDHFNDDNIKHSTLAGVIMAVDASILAIPDIGSQTITRALCSLSLILSVHCIFAGVVAQHFGQKMKSLEFASYYLHDHLKKVAIIYSAPRFTPPLNPPNNSLLVQLVTLVLVVQSNNDTLNLNLFRGTNSRPDGSSNSFPLISPSATDFSNFDHPAERPNAGLPPSLWTSSASTTPSTPLYSSLTQLTISSHPEPSPLSSNKLSSPSEAIKSKSAIFSDIFSDDLFGSPHPDHPLSTFTSPRLSGSPNLESPFDESDPEKLAKQDPLATQVWKMYARRKANLPHAQRMEDITWRMM
ncbi:hypothetical protein F4604DRAFT_1979241 [Suillus subluteus]|nr:hypothetical protein F4604DRAFT_1979241 [Suillus subluteus]